MLGQGEAKKIYLDLDGGKQRRRYTDAVLRVSGVRYLQTVTEGRHASCAETFVVYDHQTRGHIVGFMNTFY